MITTMSRKTAFFILAIAAVSIAFPASGAELTAYQLIKEGNRYVGEQAKDKVVQIRSEKSVGSMTPTIWYVVYYDSTATLKATEVKFASGKMLDVKRPLRLLEPVTGNDAALDRQKMKIDSDGAVKIASKESLLQNLKLTATQLKLERVGEGILGQSGAGQPIWKVKFWAAKVHQPSREADIGEVWVSADDGKVVKNDLHINSAD
jgi:hypothetical protein